MKFNISPNVICPHYLHHAQQDIHCESWEPGRVHRYTFSSYREYKDFQDKYCKGDYERCGIYRMIERESMATIK